MSTGTLPYSAPATVASGAYARALAAAAPEAELHALASAELAPELFVPITTFAVAAGENKADTYHLQYNWDWTTIIVRRRPGVTEAAATADLTAAKSDTDHALSARQTMTAEHQRVQGADHYAVLMIGRRATAQEIEAAHQVLQETLASIDR